MNFRLYKVLAAHGAGQIEFGTFEKDTNELKAALRRACRAVRSDRRQIDAFSLAGYIEDVQKGETAFRDDETRAEIKKRRQNCRKIPITERSCKSFRNRGLRERSSGRWRMPGSTAGFATTYRGLRKDLDLMQTFLREDRPYIFDLPMHQVPFELLFQITLCGGATDDARQFYGQIVSEIETVIEIVSGDEKLRQLPIR